MRISDILKALGDQTRLDIVLFLLTGKKNASQIISKVKKSQPNVSLALKQMTILEIVVAEKKGRETYYHLKYPEQVRTLLELLEEMSR